MLACEADKTFGLPMFSQNSGNETKDGCFKVGLLGGCGYRHQFNND